MLDPNEAATFLANEIINEQVDIVATSCAARDLYLLPRKQLNTVIEAYVNRLLNQQKENQRIDRVDYELLTMAENSIAGKILQFVIDDFSKLVFVYLCDLELNLDKTAMPLLKQGLASNNPQLQAWCLWQIYKLDPAADLDFDKVANNPEPAVRANTVLFGKSFVLKQPDSLCELIQKLKY